MSWCAVLVAGTIGCPWFRPRRCYDYVEAPCVTYVVEERCAPVHSTARPEEMAAETTATAAEESVAEPTQFSVPALFSLEMLGLQWGPATLGPGILYPVAPLYGGGAVGGFIGDPSPSSVPAPPSVVVVPIPTGPTPGPTPPGPGGTPLPQPGGGPPPSPVPEPTAIGVWIVALAVIGRQLRRKGPVT